MVGCSLGRERWDGKEEEGEIEEESVGRGGVYNGFYRWNHRRINSVGDSAMSLYDYLSLNPSVIPSVKSSEKTPRHHVVASFQTKCIVHRRYGRYIPTVSPTELVHRYIPSDFETEFSSSVITTNGIFSSIIPLVFSGFLVVEVFLGTTLSTHTSSMRGKEYKTQLKSKSAESSRAIFQAFRLHEKQKLAMYILSCIFH